MTPTALSFLWYEVLFMMGEGLKNWSLSKQVFWGDFTQIILKIVSSKAHISLPPNVFGTRVLTGFFS